MTSELKPLADMHPCPPSSGGGKRHRSRVYADGRQHYCERCGEKIDATTFSNIPETYVTTHDAGDYNKPRAVPDVPELVRYDKGDICLAIENGYDPLPSKDGEYVLHSQAAEIFATKDAEIAALNKLNALVTKQREEANAYGDEGHKRAAAAEAKLAIALEAEKDAKQSSDDWKKLAKDQQAELAQYEAQKPIGFVSPSFFDSLNIKNAYSVAAFVVMEKSIKYNTPLYASPATAPDLKTEMERLREVIENSGCPRPCNGRSDDTTVKECISYGECACVYGTALNPSELKND